LHNITHHMLVTPAAPTVTPKRPVVLLCETGATRMLRASVTIRLAKGAA